MPIEVEKRYGFEIRTSLKLKKYLTTSTEAEREKWVDAIEKSIAMLNSRLASSILRKIENNFPISTLHVISKEPNKDD